MGKTEDQASTSLFTVYSQRCAGYLMNRGFPLIKLSSDPQSTKNVFLFANTPALHKAIEVTLMVMLSEWRPLLKLKENIKKQQPMLVISWRGIRLKSRRRLHRCDR